MAPADIVAAAAARAGRGFPAEALPDHRLIYLEYEGPISGDRGTVVAWDRGEYRLKRQSDAEWVIDSPAGGSAAAWPYVWNPVAGNGDCTGSARRLGTPRA